MERTEVERWVAGYERLWRTPGTDGLAELFTDDAVYVLSPWRPPVEGLDAIAAFWDSGRDGPDEPFTMQSEVLAVEDDTAVVHVEVDYHRGSSARWRDLWVIHFGADGRCRRFEEWPFAPGQRDGHE